MALKMTWNGVEEKIEKTKKEKDWESPYNRFRCEISCTVCELRAGLI